MPPLLLVKMSSLFLLIRLFPPGFVYQLMHMILKSLSSALMSLTSLSLWLCLYYRRLLVIWSPQVLHMMLSLLDLRRFFPTVGPWVLAVVNSGLWYRFSDWQNWSFCVILVLLDLTAAFDLNFSFGTVDGHQGHSAWVVQVLFRRLDFMCQL